MNYNQNLIKPRKLLTTHIGLMVSLLFISCADKSQSVLIDKINAVQEQVMAQGNLSPDEEQAILGLCSIMTQNDGLANYSPDTRMILKDVQKVPTFEGCEGLSQEEMRKCFKNKVATFIKHEFDLSVSKKLNLSEQQQVEAFFIVDENGNPNGMKVRDTDVTIQAEILRILRRIPKMEPAFHEGKETSVLCSVVIKYGNDINAEVVYIPELPNE